MSTTKRLTKHLIDTIPQGPNPDPHLKFVSVRLDVVQESIDHFEWLEKGVAEWRDVAQTSARHAEAARATARVAIGHLQRVLQYANDRIPQEQPQQSLRDAEDWLISIGSEPS